MQQRHRLGLRWLGPHENARGNMGKHRPERWKVQEAVSPSWPINETPIWREIALVDVKKHFGSRPFSSSLVVACPLPLLKLLEAFLVPWHPGQTGKLAALTGSHPFQSEKAVKPTPSSRHSTPKLVPRQNLCLDVEVLWTRNCFGAYWNYHP